MLEIIDFDLSINAIPIKRTDALISRATNTCKDPEFLYGLAMTEIILRGSWEGEIRSCEDPESEYLLHLFYLYE